MASNGGQVRWLRERRRVDRVRQVMLSALEPRVLFCGVCQAGDLGTFDAIADFHPTSNFQPTTPVATDGAAFAAAVAGDVSYAPLSDVPILHSHPSSTVKLYLDFTGAAAMQWGSYSVPTTPAYDADGDATTFSGTELSNVNQIWARVAEKYSPFNIDVTTEDPGTYAAGQAVRAVVGGGGAWLGSAAGGVSYVSGFTFGLPGSPYGGFANQTTVFAFSSNLGGGNAKYTAEAISHEAGHNFGLQHQSTYSGTTKTNEYNPGTSATAPIMGNSYYATRGLWWNGQNSISSTTVQDDLSVIARTLNGFGYRTDDYGGTASAATALTLDANDQVSVSASGVIEKTTDQDWFAFETGAGQVQLTLSMAPYGGMLDGAMKVTSADGSIVYATADTTSLGESLTLTLQEGTYRVEVYSHGHYGDVGQYTLSGTVVQADPNFVAAPTNLAATRAADGVKLTWTDRSVTETGYTVERTDDGGQTWATLDDALPADAATYTDTSAVVGSSYGYRVSAFNANASSLTTPTVNVTVVPAAPQNLSASAVAATQLNLAWDAVTGATGYKIEKSTNGGATWTAAGTVAAGVTSYVPTGLTSAAAYLFRVKATSGVGDSPASATAAATTVPLAPPTLTAAAVSASQVTLTWTRVTGATNYKVDRSDDGGTSWTEIATVAGTLGTYANTGLTAATTYTYRVRATNAGGSSAASATAARATLAATPTNLAAALDPSAATVTVSWDAVPGATGYKLQCQVGTAAWTVLATTDDSTTTFTHANLAGGTVYKYAVTALAPTGNSLATTPVSVLTRPVAPTTLTAVAVSPAQINLSWTNVNGESGYRVDWSTDGGNTWAPLRTTTANIVALASTGLTANTAYAYRVRAYNASGESDNTAAATTTTLLPAPTGVATTVVSANVVTVTWSDQAGENGFKIERAAGTSTAYTLVGTVGAGVTSFDVTGLAGGTSYKFRVRALNAGGISAPSLAPTGLTKPAAPAGFVATAVSPTQINLAWAKAVGATAYKVERSDDGGSTWAPLATLTATVAGYYDKTAIQDTTSTYRVTATDASGDSDPSVTASATPTAALAVQAPTNLVASVTGVFGQLKLTWIDNATNETKFTVQRSADGGTTWADLTSTAANATSFVDTKVARGTTYSYRVRAADLWYVSDYSNAASATTVSAEVAGFRMAAGGTTTSVNLAWNDVVGETGYRIEQLVGTTWTPVATPAAGVTTTTIAGLTAGKTYPFRIKSLNGSGESGFSTVLNAVTVPPAPTGVTATAVTSSRVNVTWPATDGAASYRLERSGNGGATWTLLTTTTATVRSYANLALLVGTTYEYRVTAVNAAGASAASDVASATPSTDLDILPPTAVSTTLVNNGTQVALAWTNVSANTTQIAIQRAPAGTTAFATLVRVPATAMGYTDTTAAAGAGYVYRLFAINAYMTSVASATTAGALTVPRAVTGLRLAAASTASTVTLGWTDVAGDTGYAVEYSTDNATWTLAGTTVSNAVRYTVTGLSEQTRYYFRVRATNASGESPVGTVIYTATAASSGALTAATLPTATGTDAPSGPLSAAAAGAAPIPAPAPAPRATPFSSAPITLAPLTVASLWDELALAA